MNKLNLEYSSILQGEFKSTELNLLFTFQVNCPGCFFYGFPLVNELYKEHKNEMTILGLSTAFEDFELNTEENTKLLLEKSELVGETKKALNQQGFELYSKTIDFPIAMDKLYSRDEFITDKNVESICNLNPNYSIWPYVEQRAMRKNMTDYLGKYSTIPATFTLNQFRGTPTFILFNQQYTILEHWFGHKEPHAINELLAKWIT
ncbi:MAG: hypothetical protein L3J46_04805 [Kangiellaceae bacterium]|nr:hypothetical protein [Kangiellaceae bacterium]